MFHPLPSGELNPLFGKGSYMYLYRSAANYARLLGKEWQVDVDIAQRDFTALLNKLDALLPSGQELRLEEWKERLRLRVINNLDTHTLYYLPCKIVDETQGGFREILLEFFRLLHATQRLTPMTETRYFEYWKEEYESSFENHSDTTGENPDGKWAVLVSSYLEGDACRTLRLVRQTPNGTVEELAARVRRYTPCGVEEKEILARISDGLKLLKTGKALLSYTHAPRGCTEEYPVDADHLFMVTYDDDPVCEDLVDYMNNEAQECGYEFFSSIDRAIHPKTKRLAQPDTFVERFIQWLNDFSDVLYHR